MKLIVHTDPQGSPEWLEARLGVITGSRFKDARDTLKSGRPSEKQLGYAMDCARERFGGKVPQIFQSGAMKQGTEQEPVARNRYEAETGNFVAEAGFITTEDRRFGVSVDGLVDDDGIIEIKTMVSSKTLFTAVVEGDISEYVDQVNGALWLLGRKWADLILWAPDIEAAGGKGLHVIHIDRDDDAIEALESALMQFAVLVDDFERRLRLKAA
jgi:YqaJ-like viral recombinase domain